MWDTFRCGLNLLSYLFLALSVSVYSWPLSNTGLNSRVPLTHGFFSTKCSWQFVSFGFAFTDSSKCGWKQYLHIPNHRFTATDSQWLNNRCKGLAIESKVIHGFYRPLWEGAPPTPALFKGLLWSSQVKVFVVTKIQLLLFQHSLFWLLGVWTNWPIDALVCCSFIPSSTYKYVSL